MKPPEEKKREFRRHKSLILPSSRTANAYRARRRRFDLLAAWYGTERAATEIAAHTAEAVAIGGILDEVLLDPERRSNPGAIVQLCSMWKKIVGPTMANFTNPKSLRNGKLTVSVRHSALIPELSLSKDLFVQAVCRNFNDPALCTEIIFTVG